MPNQPISYVSLWIALGTLAWGSSPAPHDNASHSPAPHASAPKSAGVAPAAHGAPKIHTAVIPSKSHGHPANVEISAPDLALKRLLAGNQRFVSATMSHANQTLERRTDLATSQAPFAIIVSCSDSRVPPEIIFDQGIGDLFVVRSAGEVMGEVGIGSIEYAVAHLGSSLILVMGHERCGAVKATLEGGEAPGSIGFVCAHIKPAVDRAKKEGGAVLDNAIQYNADYVASKLSQSPIIREALASGKVKIVRSVYDLDDGIVKLNP